MKKFAVSIMFFLPVFVFASINTDIKYKDTGDDVVTLQSYLVEKGLLGVNAVTGFFGDLTLNAVKIYQEFNGLPSTGYVGSMTRAQINSDLLAQVVSTVPIAPSSLTATAVSTSQINLSWTDNSSNETGFRIERRTSTGTFSQVATVGSNVTSYSNTGRALGTQYYYRVRAYNSTGNSGYSNEATATTPISTKFVINDRIITVATVNVRNNPSTSAVRLGTQPTNSLGVVVAGPVRANGYTWWQVNFDSGVDGWTTETYLVLSGGSSYPTPYGTPYPTPYPTPTYSYPTPTYGTPYPTPATFGVGSRINTTANVYVRTTPSVNGAITWTQLTGAVGTITSGPSDVDGYRWWQIDYDSGGDGWSAETYLVLSGGSSYPTPYGTPYPTPYPTPTYSYPTPTYGTPYGTPYPTPYGTPTYSYPTPTYGTPYPTPPTQTGAGGALRFYGNGTNGIDRLKIPLDNPEKSIDVGGNFTVEFWVKMTQSENNSPACTTGNDNWIKGNIIIDRDVFGNGDRGDYGISVSGGRVAFGVNNGSSGAGICGTRNVADNNWHHIAVTRSSSNGALAIYVDGSIDGQGSGPTGDLSYRNGRSTSYPNDPFVVIGAEKHDYDKNNFPPFSGYLEEVRFSNTVRYPSSFTKPASPFNVDSSTVALYHFDETSGNVAADSTGANPATRYFGGSPSGPVWVTSDAPISW